MSAAALLARQIRATNRVFWRNPASAFFTFAFPLLFLVIFTTLLGGGETVMGGIRFDDATYYVVAMATFGVITACYTNLAMGVVIARHEGILKRVRGTPVPPWVYLTARVAHAVLIGFLLVAITAVFGVVAYGAAMPAGADLGRFILAMLLGAGCFAAIGLAVSGLGAERRRRPADRERVDPPAAVPVGRVHPDRRRRARLGARPSARSSRSVGSSTRPALRSWRPVRSRGRTWACWPCGWPSRSSSRCVRSGGSRAGSEPVLGFGPAPGVPGGSSHTRGNQRCGSSW